MIFKTFFDGNIDLVAELKIELVVIFVTGPIALRIVDQAILRLFLRFRLVFFDLGVVQFDGFLWGKLCNRCARVIDKRVLVLVDEFALFGSVIFVTRLITYLGYVLKHSLEILCLRLHRGLEILQTLVNCINLLIKHN